MFLASLARARPCARLIAPRLPRLYSTVPPMDPELRRLLEAQMESQTDPAVRRELNTLLNAPAPPMPDGEHNEQPDEEAFDFGPDGPQHATILNPPEVGRTSQDLFGIQDRSTLQTLPDGFDTRELPLPGPLGTDYTEIEYAATVVHGRSIHRPFRHPRTHALPAAQIQFRSHDILSMHLFVHFATHAAYSLGIPCSRMYSLPTQRQLWTVLRGPFAQKKAQENFERKVHRRGIKAYDADPGVVDLWFKYLERHAMGGVGMRCVKWERMPLGAGQRADTRVLDNLNRAKQLSSRIKSLGEKIVRQEMGVQDTPPVPDNIRTVVQTK
ncbi:ribosomal protein S10 domain-containing protein [Mycena rosella]|uniref:Ribosomal protein S10 domain-containing protein n=1 Tax=Mycena rosella TaxID=1033263 RepID=A0AAD7CD51_MYCRO|nr:ribosomal protein S10 domain-containing protein [Mycena rosella]